MQSVATPISDWLIIAPVLLPLLGAAILLMLQRADKGTAIFAGLVILAVVICDGVLLARVGSSGTLSMTMGRWLPPFGISFTADLMGAAFAFVAASIILAVLIYLQMDVPERVRRNGIYSLLLLLLAGVSGAFLTGDLFNLYVWFEVTLIASFGLIVIGGRTIQLDAAVKYGILNFLATSLFLAALGLLYGLIGTVNMADIIRSAPKADPAVMTGIGALFLLAFGLKAAAFPVNAWLPASYHAPPAAISALLAGLMTKVGIYALIRTLVLLLPASRDLLEPALVTIAAATLVLAPLGAIAETNLRRALGFLVIGGIGAILAGIALPGAAGTAGSIAYVLHSMLTMTALFLAAGLIEKLTGETDSRRMGGLYASRTSLSIMFLVLVLAVSGVPPFLGFWPKLLLLTSALDQPALSVGSANIESVILVVALLLNALLTLIAGTRLWSHIFWRAAPARTATTGNRNFTTKERQFGWSVVALLVSVVAIVGFRPEPLIALGQSAAAALSNPQAYENATGIEASP